MGLRSEKKKKIRDKILNTSSRLFLTQGYKNTTTEQISNTAEIGAGTLYNYFKSKAEIFVEVFAQEFQNEEYPDLEMSKGICAAEIIYSYIMKYLGKHLHINKKLLQELMIAGLGLLKTHPKLFRRLIDDDYKFMDSLGILVDQMKRNKIISDKYETKETAEIIYSIFAYEIILYLFEENITLEYIKQELLKKLKILFD